MGSSSSTRLLYTSPGDADLRHTKHPSNPGDLSVTLLTAEMLRNTQEEKFSGGEGTDPCEVLSRSCPSAPLPGCPAMEAGPVSGSRDNSGFGKRLKSASVRAQKNDRLKSKRKNNKTVAGSHRMELIPVYGVPVQSQAQPGAAAARCRRRRPPGQNQVGWAGGCNADFKWT